MKRTIFAALALSTAALAAPVAAAPSQLEEFAGRYVENTEALTVSQLAAIKAAVEGSDSTFETKARINAIVN